MSGRNRPRETLIVAGMLLAAVICTGICVGIFVVVVHFVEKFW